MPYLEYLIIIILVINTVIALVYLIYGLVRRRRAEQERGHRGKYVMLAFVILVTPPVGICFLAFSHILYKLGSGKEVDMSDVSFSRERVKVDIAADIGSEINIVPMKEALNVSDTALRRRMLLDVLKRDTAKAMATLSVAIENPDSETSHYAASVMTDALSEFRGTVQNMAEALKKDPEDMDLAVSLLSSLLEVLGKGMLIGTEKSTYTHMANDTAQSIYDNDVSLLKGADYKRLAGLLTDIGIMSTAEEWVRRGMEQRPESLDVYVGAMKYYYTIKNRDRFFECLDRLKRSSVVLDNEAMQYMRLFRR